MTDKEPFLISIKIAVKTLINFSVLGAEQAFRMSVKNLSQYLNPSVVRTIFLKCVTQVF